MEIRNLGQSGLRVSTIGLGCNNFGGRIGLEATRAVIHKAIDLGITLFDTADTYGERGGSETDMGQVLGDRRKDIVLATKFGNPMDNVGVKQGGARRYIMTAVEDSLRRLRTDYIDLYQLHGFDAKTPIEEVLQTLDTLVRAGKIRYIGCSNFSGWHLMKSLALADRLGLARYVAHQAYYSLVGREFEWELMPLALDQHVGTVVWSPLGWGRLTGRIRRGQPLPETSRLQNSLVASLGPPVETEHLYRVVDAIDEVARETGKTVPQVALNWLSQRPSISTIIIGARNEEQLRQNLDAVGWRLDAAQVKKLDEASATTLVYPYWHQRGFTERNPPPV